MAREKKPALVIPYNVLKNMTYLSKDGVADIFFGIMKEYYNLEQSGNEGPNSATAEIIYDQLVEFTDGTFDYFYKKNGGL